MRILAAILFMGFSQISLAEIHELKFSRVSQSNDIATCQDFILDAVEEFKFQTGIHVIDSGCKLSDSTLGKYDATIIYQADAAVSRTSSYYSSVYSSSFYDNLDECRSQLRDQRQLFTIATDLKPLASYCMVDSSSLSKRWATRVDGIGQTASRPSVIGTMIRGSIITPREVISNFTDAAEDYGFYIFENGIVNSGSIGKLVLRVYTTEHFSFHEYTEMQYGSPQNCANAAIEVRTALETTDKPTVSFCTKNSNSMTTLHVTSFINTTNPQYVFKATELTTNYTSQQSCQQAADNISLNALDIFGAICSGSNQNYKIHLFSN